MRLARFLGPFLVGALILTPVAHAFRSVNLESYTDPDYKGYVPKKVVLLVANAGVDARRKIEEGLAVVLAEKGVVVVPYRQVLPPTRTWSKEAEVEVYKKEGIDSGLIVAIGATSSTVIPIATQAFGSYGTGTFSGTSYNISGARSKAECSAVLLHLDGNRTVWYADVSTKASGTMFVGETRDAKAFAKAIASRLAEDGHLSAAP